MQAFSQDEPLREMLTAIHRDLDIPTSPSIKSKSSFALDEAPFFDAGARTIYFNSVADNNSTRLWHRPEDLPGTVDPLSVEHSLRVIAELVRRIDRLER